MSRIPADVRDLADASLGLLRQALANHPRICYASSLGAESVVLTDLLWSELPQIEVFTIDTGRLFPQTRDLIERIQRHYGRRLKIYSPDAAAVESWVARHGIDGFRSGTDQRRSCCQVRKIEPFRRAIAGYDAWVTGIRSGQSVQRARAQPLAWDPDHGLYKVSPLLAWSEEQVWSYIRARELPYNTLHDLGFPSIGCAPCTRAVAAGEDPRSGRWWWEREESRECGLHPRLPALVSG
ncbi:MAG: phosphoadenylyl-sulfate reductase [Gammaproteobacteria bacterium]|nr:phosphoadenylyl-sulfate reductase [Gammaproteobacteria bacterium]